MNFSWELQPFDSGILEFKTAKILSITSSKDIFELIQDLKKHNIRYATYRFPATDFLLIHALEKLGFLLVDILVSLKLDAITTHSFEPQEYIQPAQPTDADELIRLSSSVFSLNRFYNDPFIPKEKANRIFGKWMENSLNRYAADEVLVYKQKSILGFITLQKNGHIPLVGVSQEARGKGIAKKLVTAGLSWFENMHIQSSEIETQVTNIAALRAYMSCGFKITNSFVTYRISVV